MEIGLREIIMFGIGVVTYFVRSENNKSILKLEKDLNEKIQSNKDLITNVKNEHDRNNDKVMTELVVIKGNLERTERSMKQFSDESSASRDLMIKMYDQIMQLGSKRIPTRGKK